jgi:ectoine hydroxylase-related dioxygenase (phytanoyl-CoA dioxygenase family)
MVGDTTWHPDGYRPNLHPDDWPLRLERIAATFYLDPVGRDSGALRIIPGSHRPPLYHDLKRLLAYSDEPTYAPLASLRQRREDPQSPAFGVAQPDLPCFPLESEPGDVIFWNANLWHSSFGGRAGRRMCRVAFTRNPTAPEQIEYLRLYHRMATDSRKKLEPGWTAPYHEPAFLESPRPRLRRLAERLRELGLQ